MSFTEHPITRWDGVTYADHATPRPMLYLVPTLEFLDIAERNNYIVRVDIRGANQYDKEHQGVIYSSSNMPNCRQNFSNITGEYVIVLENTSWLGYPHGGNGACRVKDRYPSAQKDQSLAILKIGKSAEDEARWLEERALKAAVTDRSIDDVVKRTLQAIDNDNMSRHRTKHQSNAAKEGVDRGYSDVSKDLQKAPPTPSSNGGNGPATIDNTTRIVLYVIGGVVVLAIVIALVYAISSRPKLPNGR